MPVRFLTDFDPAYGEAVEVIPGVLRVVARNPSKYTRWGTGTYIVGSSELAVVDPGPDDAEHLDALMSAVNGRPVTHVLVTHTHADHSPAAATLAELTGATTYGYGPHPPGTDDEAEEHGDHAFVPEVEVRDGDHVTGADFDFECLHTPGHISNHVCYSERRRGVLFPGDHVMGWSTTVISPPDGQMRQYVENLTRLLERDEDLYLPTHGPPIPEPRSHVAALIEHRAERERQVIDQIATGARTVDELVAVLYAEVDPTLHAPAARSVRAHLIALVEDGKVEGPGPDDRYRLRS